MRNTVVYAELDNLGVNHMLFGIFGKWNASVKKLQSNETTFQEFVNVNKSKTLFYSTPFFEVGGKQRHNALQTGGSDVMFFPAFSYASDLRAHLSAIGCTEYVIIKGDLKSVLDSLDSHPMLEEWGVVIDPHTSDAVGLPPKIRVQPSHIR